MAHPEPSWSADAADVDNAAVTHFARWLVDERGAPPAVTDDYRALHRWSVDNLGAFWAATSDYFDIAPGYQPQDVLSGHMPDVTWFPGARVNYCRKLLSDSDHDDSAIIDVAEPPPGGDDGTPQITTVSWRQLTAAVAAFAETLRKLGVRPGDRVVGYLPTISETTIAFLGCAAVGAVWASCGQDYSAGAAAKRFAQLEPVVLIAADGYRFAGRRHDRTAAVAELRALLPTLRYTVWVPRISGPVPPDVVEWAEATAGDQALVCTDVPFDHPLWVVFSSGTTGMPKGVVHGHGGILLEHMKVLSLHNGVRRGQRVFWYTTPSWMVWNYQTSALLLGATIVCYDGSPTHPGADALFGLAGSLGVSLLGVSPGYLQTCARAGTEPAEHHDLSSLRTLISSGSHLPATAYDWVGEHVGTSVQVVSTSGGTDVVSAFAGATPTLPVWPGELSCPCLGVDLQAWTPEGRPVVGQTGELVVTQPMPSMPLYLWGDPDWSRYVETYLSVFPGVWRHGDWITITERGSVIVSGRSDSTLNRNGVRMGSADIYDVVESVPEVTEALVIGAEQSDGSYWMPLFVTLVAGTVLDAHLREKIRDRLRAEVSPRHVPDDVQVVPWVPHTITGKKLEVPVKRILQGASFDEVADIGSVDDAESLKWFVNYRDERQVRGTADAVFQGGQQ